MNLVTLPFRLPLLPVRGLVQLAEIIRDEAERELHDPAPVRRQLEEVEEARRAGAASDEEIAEAETEATERLVAPHRGPAPAPARGDRS
jgi:cytochrome c-type biogenesis protein CcmH/NrfG